MTSLLMAIFAFPVVIVSLVTLRRLSHSLRPSENHNGVPRPPLMASWIPFVGNALSMAGGDLFWVKAQHVIRYPLEKQTLIPSRKRYGPAIRILTMGDIRTFVTSPGLINHIYKSSKSFDFLVVRKLQQCVVFGLDRKASYSPVFDNHLFDDHHRAMQPGAMADVIRRYADLLEMEMRGRLEELDKDESTEVDFVDFVFDIIYTASSKALFSPSFPSAATKKPFLAFDEIFPVLLLTSIPSLLRSPAESARNKMLSLLEEWWSTTSEEDKKLISPAMTTMLDVVISEGWSERDWASLTLASLWAAEANSPYAGIWTVAEILRDPSLLSTLRNEVDQAISTLSPPDLWTLLHLPQAQLITTLPRINAAFQETLRYYTSSYSLRIVQGDTTLPASLCGNHTGYSLKKGEEVICVSRANQVDPKGDWGKDADQWDGVRFLDGKREKGSMMPFGGGVSMCEGRHFASAEILTFIAAFLHLVDAEIVSGGDTLRPDIKRIGMALLHPKGNCKVRLRRRGVQSAKAT